MLRKVEGFGLDVCAMQMREGCEAWGEGWE